MNRELFGRRCATPHPDGGVEYGKHSFDADGYCNVCGVHRNITLRMSYADQNAMNTPETPSAVSSMRLLGDGQLCDDCGGRIGSTCVCPIATATEYLLQGIPALCDQWATISRGTLEKMTAEKLDYENETGLAWRGYRLLKAVTTYHTCGESPNAELSGGVGRRSLK